MRHLLRSVGLVWALAACVSSTDTDPKDSDAPSPLLDVEESAAWQIPGLQGTAYVLTTEGGIPNGYVITLSIEAIRRSISYCYVSATSRDIIQRLATNSDIVRSSGDVLHGLVSERGVVIACCDLRHCKGSDSSHLIGGTGIR